MYKKLLMTIFSVALLLIGVMCVNGVSEAEDGGIISKEYSEISSYRSSEEFVVPDGAPEGYIFAGWYQDYDDTTGKFSAPLTENDVSGKAFAKFVPDYVLSVKAQVNQVALDDHITADNRAAIRFVTSVDSLDYRSVGFVITRADKEDYRKESESKTVTKTLYYVGTQNGENIPITPAEAFGTYSEYFKAFTFVGMPNEAVDTEITARSYWITLDGTRVEGVAVVKTVNKGRSWIFVNEKNNIDGNQYGTKDHPYTSITEASKDILLEEGGKIFLQSDMELASQIDIGSIHVTIQDDGMKHTLSRSSTWTEAVPMFQVAAGGTLSLVSTGNDEENGSRLVVDGNGANVDSTANRLVSVPANSTVNIGAGVRICNFIQTIKGDDVGGVARVTGGTLNITGGIFDGNQAASGGVIAATGAGSVINITGGTFINNKATVNHGGVFRIVTKSTLIADGAYFKGNEATAEAGVLWLGNYATTVEVKNCIFEANTTATWGGVISSHNTNTSASLLLENNRFSENISVDTKSHGRDINLAGAVKAVTMKDNSFDNGGDHVVINNTGTEVKLSGENTFEVYMNGANALKSNIAALKLTDTFDPRSRITLVSSIVPTIGNCVATCQSEVQAAECLGSFSMVDYGLEAFENGMVLNGDVASVGTSKYRTLQEAVDAAAESAENVVMLTDVTLKETVTVPAGSNITIIDDGVSTRKIMRNSTMGDVPMFGIAEGGTATALTFASTSDKNPMLIVDGAQSLVKEGGTTATRLVEIPTGVTVNVGSGVKICNHKTSNVYAIGGAFNVKGGTLNIIGGIFDGNESPSGGVIATNSASSKVEITGGTFTNNKATANHGGVFRIDTTTTLNMENAVFEGNTSAGHAGVLRIQNQNVDVTIRNCTFEKNHAGSFGGAISNMSSNAGTKVLIEDSQFLDNTAKSGGSAINLAGAVKGVTLKNNHEFISSGNDVRIDTSNAEINLSGANTFEVYIYGTAALNLNADFDTSSKIVIMCHNPVDGNVVVACPDTADYLECFTLSTKLSDYVLEAEGSNIKIRSR